MAQHETQQRVLHLLSDFEGLEPAKQLFWSELNYDRVNQPLSRRDWTDSARQALAEDPILLAGNDGFHVIYGRLSSEKLLLGLERSVASRLLRDHPYVLFVLSNESQDHWHFLNIKYDEELKRRHLYRRITVGPEERLRTASERISLLDLDAIDRDLFGLSPLTIQQRHDEAFDVEVVTKQFFEIFAHLYHKVASDIAKVRGLEKDAGKLAQVLLDRMLFLYFVQKKGWLDEKHDYLYSRFQECWKKDSKGHSYYSDVLYPLFLCLSDSHTEMDVVGAAPFLNGGLFEESITQTQAERLALARFQVKNTTFKAIFEDLLERFNFTVTEDTPLDVEVAIDPEMLGKIFESLILQLERDPDKDLRKLTGSYYTPRPIVHFMCQEALKEYLVEQLKSDTEAKAEMMREKIGEFLALPPAYQLDEEQTEVLKTLFTPAEAKTVRHAILDCRVCDPAVGSGAFPVGMLHEMVAAVARLDLYIKGSEVLKQRNYDYDLKKQIIESCLYGVDIQEQAVRLCELRLWLSLVVDYQIDPNKPFAKAIREIPSLPNLSYRIIRGDSLLERLFGRTVQLDQITRDAKSQQLIESIQADKMSYFREGNTSEKRRLELKILTKQADLTERLIEAKQTSMQMYQTHLLGEDSVEAKDRKIRERNQAVLDELSDLKTKVARAKNELSRLSRQKGGLNRSDLDNLRRRFFETGESPSFIWQTDFAEVFVKKGGFDVMIANPPYMTYSRVTGSAARKSQDVKEYKEALRLTYPKSAEYKLSTYAIFMDAGIKHLCPSGVLVWITPDTYLTGRYFSKVRKLILDECRIQKLTVFLEDFWEQGTVGFPTISVLAKNRDKHSRDRNLVTSMFLDSDESLRTAGGITRVKVPQAYYYGTPYNRFRMYRSPEDHDFVAKLDAQPIRLDTVLKFGVGIRSKVGANAIVGKTPKSKKWKKGFIDGNEVIPFKVSWKGNFIEIDPKKLWAGGFRKEVVESRKILIRKTGNSIIAAIDDNHFYHLDILHSAVPKETSFEMDLRYILGVLNSEIMDRYYQIITMSYGRVMAQTNLETLESLPIAVPSREAMVSVCNAVKRLEKHHESSKEYEKTLREIESMLEEIYLGKTD